jgi:hypothetical protein
MKKGFGEYYSEPEKDILKAVNVAEFQSLLARKQDVSQFLKEGDMSPEERRDLEQHLSELTAAIDIHRETLHALNTPDTLRVLDLSREPITAEITDSIQHAYTQYLEKQAEVDDLKKEREMLAGLVAPEALPTRLQEIDARIAVAEAEAAAANKKRGPQLEEDEF